MLRGIIYIIVIVFVLTFGFVIKAGERPIPESQWNSNTKIWLARSCAGEAGFDAVDECIGIAWVYATRLRVKSASGMSLETMIRRYSSAVKPKSVSTHTRRWIRNLTLDGKKPIGWPHDLKWENHRGKWLEILRALDEWADGNRPNPVLGADHYGGSMDSPGKLWVRIDPVDGLKFSNRFYRSPGAPPVDID